jgi:hypothetical protein
VKQPTDWCPTDRYTNQESRNSNSYSQCFIILLPACLSTTLATSVAAARVDQSMSSARTTCEENRRPKKAFAGKVMRTADAYRRCLLEPHAKLGGGSERMRNYERSLVSAGPKTEVRGSRVTGYTVALVLRAQTRAGGLAHSDLQLVDRNEDPIHVSVLPPSWCGRQGVPRGRRSRW